MKSDFLLFALVITFGFYESANATELLDKLCLQQSGASQDDLAMFKRGQVPTSKAGKCFIACDYKTIGAIKDGKYNAEGVTQHLADQFDSKSPEWEKIKTMAKTCEKSMAHESSTDECEYAAKAMTCEVAYLKKVGFM